MTWRAKLFCYPPAPPIVYTIDRHGGKGLKSVGCMPLKSVINLGSVGGEGLVRPEQVQLAGPLLEHPDTGQSTRRRHQSLQGAPSWNRIKLGKEEERKSS